MKGYNVLFPMGFDAFGLPAENAAIKHNINPREWTYANIERMRAQLRSMGAMFDWRREAISSDPAYYRWTQWFFVQLQTWPGLSQVVAGGLLPALQYHAGA
jgi:leucyl-tRNA synthetase